MFFIFSQRRQGFPGKWEEYSQIENSHQSDAYISQVPYHRVSLNAADKKHDQSQDLIKGLPQPAVSKEISHIGAGIKENAKEGGKTEQRQSYSRKDHAEASKMIVHSRL